MAWKFVRDMHYQELQDVPVGSRVLHDGVIYTLLNKERQDGRYGWTLQHRVLPSLWFSWLDLISHTGETYAMEVDILEPAPIATTTVADNNPKETREERDARLEEEIKHFLFSHNQWGKYTR